MQGYLEDVWLSKHSHMIVLRGAGAGRGVCHEPQVFWIGHYF